MNERGELSNFGGDLDPTGRAMPHTEFISTWRQTEALRLLRQLLDLSGTVAPTIARRANLGHSELRALECLVRAPHGLVELARELGVTPAASSAIVDRLEARGHASRQPHPSDGRRTQVVLTDTGREEVLGYLFPMFVALAKVDDRLDEAERAVVERFLTGCIDAIRRVL